MLAAVVLAVASAMVLYIIAGYPILLAFIPRRAAPPVQKDKGFRATVSVLLAVRNGEEFIRGKLECLLGLDYPAQLMEIVVVSDGSTDATEAIAESFADRGVRLIRAPRAGKAAAINAALGQASGEILFFTDVRQALDAEALSHLVANFADPSIGAVTGELRYLDPDKTGEEADMELYWRYELFARRRHSRIDSTFSATGCIYAIRRSLTGPIPPDTLSDDVVIPLRSFFRGYRVIFDPEAIAFDHPTAEGGEFRRKLRTLAGIWQVHARLPELFTSANRMRLDFLSHRFARLALPWALLLVWAATMALPASPFRRFLLIDELALVALAALDYVVPKGFFLKRVSSPARTFLAMNLASLLAVGVFVVPPETLWRPTRVKVRRR
jgi:cellulose synthase/poly-beta-1,6-N-acetylglucosamine synthase-like glycosyltransferase